MNNLSYLSGVALRAAAPGQPRSAVHCGASRPASSDTAWRAAMLDQTEDLTARGSAEVDMGTGVAQISPGLARLAGRPEQPGRTDLCTLIGWLLPDEQDFVQSVIESAADGEPFNCFHHVVRPDGSARFVHQHGIVRVDAVGRRVACLSFHDVSERHRIDMELLHRASTDAATGLPNRHQLVETVEAAVKGMAWDDRGVALLVLQVEPIDELLCTLAQAEAETLARTVGDRLRALLPQPDAPNADPEQEWFVARTGGAEFTMLLRAPQAVLSALAEAQAWRIVDDPFLAGIAGLSGPAPRLSVGLAMFPHPDVARDGLMAAAQAACRDARSAAASLTVYDARTRARALSGAAKAAGTRRARARWGADPAFAAVRAGDAWPLLDQLPVAALGLDARGTVVLANAQADRLLGENMPLLGEPIEAVLGIAPGAAQDGVRLELAGRHWLLRGHAAASTGVDRLMVLAELPGH